MSIDKRKIWFLISLALTMVTIFLLVTGSPLLNRALDANDSIPVGTFITWMGMISLPLSMYWGVKELRRPTNKLNTILARSLKIVIVMAVLWLPISYLLAGNLSFSFSEKDSFQGGQTAMKWFWSLSYGIGMGGVWVMVIYGASLLWTDKK